MGRKIPQPKMIWAATGEEWDKEGEDCSAGCRAEVSVHMKQEDRGDTHDGKGTEHKGGWELKKPDGGSRQSQAAAVFKWAACRWARGIGNCSEMELNMIDP